MTTGKSMTAAALASRADWESEVYAVDFALPEGGEYADGLAYFELDMTLCPAEPSVGFMSEYYEGSASLIGVVFHAENATEADLVMTRDEAREAAGFCKKTGRSWVDIWELAAFDEAAEM